jgi:hypothetical protein
MSLFEAAYLKQNQPETVHDDDHLGIERWKSATSELCDE